MLRVLFLVSRTLVGAFLLAATAVSPAAALSPKKEARVLVLHSYHAGQSWTDSVMQGIQEVFAPEEPSILLHVEYLEIGRAHV